MERFRVERSGDNWKVTDWKRGSSLGVVARVNDGEIADQIAVMLNACYPNRLTGNELKAVLENAVDDKIIIEALKE